jgi:hypothetical protein
LSRAQQRITQLAQQRTTASHRTTVDLTRENEELKRETEVLQGGGWKERYEALARVPQALKAEVAAHAGK